MNSLAPEVLVNTFKSRHARSRPAGAVDGTDLRNRYPGFDPPNGWHESRPRHALGWIVQLIEDINCDGGSARLEDDSTRFDDGRADVFVIESLHHDWGAFREPWRIELTESRLERHLRTLLKPDGTVHGLDDPDEAVETDGMIAAYNLFTHHLEEESSRADGLVSFEYVLTPGTGLHPRDRHGG